MKTLKHVFLLLTFIFLSVSMTAREYTVEDVPNVQLKNARAFVSNPDNILSTQTVATLDTMLYNLRVTNSSEFVVVALSSIGSEDPKQFAIRLFEKWGIGRKEKDNGLLLLFVLDQRRAVTEVGYGLEGILPDAINKRLMMRYMYPYFKQGDYNRGMIDGVRAFIGVMTTDEANRELFVAAPAKAAPFSWKEVLFWYLLFSFLVSLFMIGAILNSKRHAPDQHNYSIYKAISAYVKTCLLLSLFFPVTMLPIYLWLRGRLHHLRNKTQICDHCGGKMHKLSEAEEDAYLSASEQTEEKINSVDYDVWLCDNCNKVKIFPFESQYAHYSKCPVCHSKAYSLQSDRILVEPTPFSKGKGEKTYFCQHCHYTKKLPYILPIIVVVGGIGGRGGRGGMGGGQSFGGNFGGGFGGGRSGGGGASIGW